MALIQRIIEVTFQLAAGPPPAASGPAAPSSGGGLDAAGFFVESGTNTVTLSGHRASAHIVKAGGPSMSKLTLRVWGMSLSLMNQLSTLGMVFQLVPRNAVVVSAGDQISGLGTVFVGTITNAYAEFSGAPDVPFVVEAHTGIAEAVIPVPPASFQGSADAATILSGLATQMGLTFENNGVSVVLSNPYYTGSPRDQAKACARDANVEWIIDNGTLAIWPRGGSRGGAVPLISKDTGLVGYPTYTAYGLRLRTMFNPSIGYGGKVSVQTALTRASGTWVVYAITHELESKVPNGKWFSELGCYNPTFPAPVPPGLR